MNKKTIFTILFAVAVVGAIAVTALVLSKREKKQEEQTATTLAYDLADEAYDAAAQKPDVKLYGTHIDGLFYSLSPVQYYYAQEGRLEQLQAKETLTVRPVVAGTQMEFEIELIEIDGTTLGVGVWHADGGIYNDVFALLTDMPEAFASPKSYLLLLDTTRKDLSADSRLYSELLAVSESGENVSYLFAQGNRMAEPSGKLRTDWDCATAAMLAQQDGGVLTLTGRKYHHSEEAQQYDLRRTAGGNTETVAYDVCGYAAQADSGIYYIEQEQNGWSLYCSDAGEETKLASFEGNFAEECSVAGNYALKLRDGAFVDLQTGEEIDSGARYKKVYAGAASQEKLVCIGKEDNREGKDYKVQKIVVTDIKSRQSSVCFCNNAMDENSSLLICSEGIVTQKEGKSVFISFKSLASIAADVVK